jgi:hypothetical protein
VDAEDGKASSRVEIWIAYPDGLESNVPCVVPFHVLVCARPSPNSGLYGTRALKLHKTDTRSKPLTKARDQSKQDAARTTVKPAVSSNLVVSRNSPASAQSASA